MADSCLGESLFAEHRVKARKRQQKTSLTVRKEMPERSSKEAKRKQSGRSAVTMTAGESLNGCSAVAGQMLECAERAE